MKTNSEKFKQAYLATLTPEEQKAIEIFDSSEIGAALNEAAVDELVWGESMLEITSNGLRCIRRMSKEYNQILTRNGKTS